MAFAALSGQDTVIINNYVFVGLGDQNFVEMTFPNGLVEVKTGKNGNSIYGFRESGKQADVKLRTIRGGPDDQFMLNLLTQMKANFAGFPLLIGQFIKKIGDGQGNVTSDTYIFSGGVIVKEVEAKSNSEGDTEQSLALYELKFTNAPRVLS